MNRPFRSRKENNMNKTKKFVIASILMAFALFAASCGKKEKEKEEIEEIFGDFTSEQTSGQGPSGEPAAIPPPESQPVPGSDSPKPEPTKGAFLVAAQKVVSVKGMCGPFICGFRMELENIGDEAAHLQSLICSYDIGSQGVFLSSTSKATSVIKPGQKGWASCDLVTRGMNLQLPKGHLGYNSLSYFKDRDLYYQNTLKVEFVNDE